MPIKIDGYPSPRSERDGDKPKTMHPRLVDADVVETRRLAENINKRCTVTTVDVEAVLSALAETLHHELAQGHTVRLERIGNFSIVPEFTEPVHEGDRFDGGDVAVKCLRFKPDQLLLASVKHDARFTRVRSPHSSKIGLAEASLFVQRYLADHEWIDVQTFMAELHLRRDKANRLLNELVTRNKLVKEKRHGVNFFRLF